MKTPNIRLLCLIAALAAFPALAERTLLTGTATEGTPYDTTSRRLAVERLRIVHAGGPVVVVPTPHDSLNIRLEGAADLGPVTGRLIRTTPAVTVRLVEISDGNFRIETQLPASVAAPEVLPPAMSGVVFGNGIQLGEGVVIGDNRPAPQAGRPRARLVVAVPTSRLRLLSVTTAYGDVRLSSLALTAGDPSTNVIHAASGDGRVTFQEVTGAQVWGPSDDTEVVGGCPIHIAGENDVATLDRYFRAR